MCLQPCVCLDVAVRVFCPVSVLMLLCVFIDLFILFTTWGKSCAARIAPAQLMTSATQCGSSDHVTQAGNLPFFGLRLLAERSLSRKKHNEKNLFFFFFYRRRRHLHSRHHRHSLTRLSSFFDPPTASSLSTAYQCSRMSRTYLNVSRLLAGKTLGHVSDDYTRDRQAIVLL